MDKNTGLIFVNRESLLKGIAITIKNYEKCEVTSLVSNSCNPNDSETTIREDVIYVGDEVILRDKVIMALNILGMCIWGMKSRPERKAGTNLWKADLRVV